MPELVMPELFAKKRGAVRAVRTGWHRGVKDTSGEAAVRAANRRVAGYATPQDAQNAAFQEARRKAARNPLRSMPVSPSKQRANENRAAAEAAYRKKMGFPETKTKEVLAHFRREWDEPLVPAAILGGGAYALHRRDKERRLSAAGFGKRDRRGQAAGIGAATGAGIGAATGAGVTYAGYRQAVRQAKAGDADAIYDLHHLRKAPKRSKAAVALLLPAMFGGMAAGPGALAGAAIGRKERRVTAAKRGPAVPEHEYGSDGAKIAAAALGGQATYRAVGFGLKASGNAARARVKGGIPEGMSRARYDQIMAQHEKKHGIENYGPKGSWEHRRQLANTPSYSRDYPKPLLGSRQKRLLGQMSGKRGAVISGAFTLAPAVAVHRRIEARDRRDAAIRSRARRPAQSNAFVGKSVEYGYRERKVKPLRAAETGAGLALGAWGASRMKSIGSLAAFGVRIAERNGGGKEAARALEIAREVGARTRSVTGQGAQHLRGYDRVGAAIDRVPEHLRPAVATTAGALLVSNAHPVRRDRFVPTGRGF